MEIIVSLLKIAFYVALAIVVIWSVAGSISYSLGRRNFAPAFVQVIGVIVYVVTAVVFVWHAATRR